MIFRGILILGACAGSLLAQFQFYVLSGSSEQLVGSQYDFGNVQAGATAERTFRIRNTTTALANLTTVSVAGTGFSIPNPPALPEPVQPGAAVDCVVHFEPTNSGFFSAAFTADGVSVILLATEPAGTKYGTVYLAQSDGSKLPLHAGDTVDFGTIDRDATAERDFVVVNQTAAPLTVFNVSLAGSYFQFADQGILPITLPPSSTVTIRVLFAPRVSGARQATVRIEHQDFFLTGDAIDAFPQPGIVLDIASAQSAQQGTVSVRLPSASPVSGEGSLVMTFHPAGAGVLDDPAVQFLSPNNPRDSRTVIFTVTEGDTVGKFNGAAQDSATVFQTGTTAGDIVFTAELEGWKDQKMLTVPRAAIGVDSATATRTSAGLSVSINGFDNTRTASQFTFTFYDRNGTAVAPGAIPVNLSEDFASYFTKSQAGGVFGLRAVFPVSGDASVIEAVSVELVNAAGTAKINRLSFTTP